MKTQHDIYAKMAEELKLPMKTTNERAAIKNALYWYLYGNKPAIKWNVIPK